MLVKNITLHANEDLQKTVTYSEGIENSSSSQLSKGLINGEYQCTDCRKCNVPYDCLVPCGNCRKSYHITCISVPIDYDNARGVRENPGIWWICFNCLNANNSSAEHDVHDNLDKLINDKIQSLLGNFKDELLSGINSKLDSLPKQAPSTSHPASSGSVTAGLKRKAGGDNGCYSASKVRRKSVANTATVPIPQATAHVTDNGNALDGSASIVSSENSKVSDIPKRSEKYLLHYRPVSDALTLKDEEWLDLRKSISSKLSQVKVLFSHFNKKTGKVVIGFPSKDVKEFSAEILKDVIALRCYEFYTPEKMLPKLTLHNVPLDFDIPDTELSTSGLVQRDLVKGQIWKSIIDKNEGIKSLVTEGSVLEIVYFRKHKYSATVAVKVSPVLRHYILDKLHSKLFLFSSCCRVTDRCHYQQCYHCLKYGHISRNCPKADESPICMYCAGLHDSRTCEMKNSTADYRCNNCLVSKKPSINFNHCACSPNCPSAQAIASRIQLNTQLETSSIVTSSKNL